MKITKSSKRSRWLRRARGIWNELDFAQRRSFEVQTGVPVGARRGRRISRTVDELERLYAA